MKLAVKVISLAGCQRRREHMAAQLASLSLQWSFFDACTSLPADLQYFPRAARWARGRELTPGELGCFGSHVSLWRWLRDESDLDALCILEDDLLVDCNFFNGLLSYSMERGIAYLRFYGKVPVPMSYIRPGLGRHIVRFRKQVFGTQGYLITRAGAERFLSSIKFVVRPIDDEIDRFWAHGLPIYAVYPFPLVEIDFGSTIEPMRRNFMSLAPLEAARRLAFRASERARRMSRNVLFDAKGGIHSAREPP
jgi:glycosyl transferase, family 25